MKYFLLAICALLPALLVQLAAAFPAQPSSSAAGEQRWGNPEERGGYFQGDMIMTAKQMDDLASGILDENLRWPDKTVVYKFFHTNHTEDEKDMIREAIKMITDKTCIKFKEIGKDEEAENFIEIKNKLEGCNSQVGMIGGSQTLNLEGGSDHGCFSRKKMGIIVHEFVHAIGFEHEQSRTDRDDFVEIIWDNIIPGEEPQFEKYNSTVITDFGISYDYLSVMHYGRTDFGIGEGFIKAYTIETKDPKYKFEIGQRKRLSDSDAAKINAMYKC